MAKQAEIFMLVWLEILVLTIILVEIRGVVAQVLLLGEVFTLALHFRLLVVNIFHIIKNFKE